MLAQAALSAIRGYRRWISPRKGFACAHRIAHGGPSCSAYAEARIAESGLLPSLPAIRRRFRDCGAAAVTLRSEAPRKRKRRADRWYDYYIPGDCGCCGRSSHRGDGHDASPDGCDCTPGGCGD